MRTIKFVIVLVGFTLCGTVLAAKNFSNGKLLLSVKAKNKYGEQVSKLYLREGGEVICTTELSPIFPLNKGDEKQTISLAKQVIQANPKAAKVCKDTVSLSLPGTGKALACNFQIDAKNLIDNINRICGRN